MTTATASKIRPGGSYPSDGIDLDRPFVKLRGFNEAGDKFGVLLQDESADEFDAAKARLRELGVVGKIEELQGGVARSATVVPQAAAYPEPLVPSRCESEKILDEKLLDIDSGEYPLVVCQLDEGHDGPHRVAFLWMDES